VVVIASETHGNVFKAHLSLIAGFRNDGDIEAGAPAAFGGVDARGASDVEFGRRGVGCIYSGYWVRALITLGYVSSKFMASGLKTLTTGKEEADEVLSTSRAR
jgi:hypothetical protein